jgi:polyisoprenyl-teichoic acid--peptidoglycan teichoic acid transferase
MKKKLFKKKVLLSVLVIISVIILMPLAYIYNMSNKVSRVDIDSNDVISSNVELPVEAEDVTLIALFGTDYSDLYETSAADSTMILAINNKEKTIKLCSLMRDIYLYLPDGNRSNLNYTILDGGIPSILRAINFNFDLRIEKFAQVDLERLPKIIDSLGGVEINITDEELNYINSYITQIDTKNNTTTEKLTSSGLQLLNGTQASAYCRIRYTAGRDFKRTERQRDVLNALFVKFKDTKVTEFPKIINDVLPLVTTNLKNTEIISLSTKALSMGVDNIEQGRFPTDGNIISAGFTDMYHMNIDIDATTEELHKFLFSIE